jgi:hypothetical protein
VDTKCIQPVSRHILAVIIHARSVASPWETCQCFGMLDAILAAEILPEEYRGRTQDISAMIVKGTKGLLSIGYIISAACEAHITQE